MTLPHPLDEEQIRVTVKLEHVPTGTVVEETLTTGADDGQTVHETIEQVEDVVMDTLLAQLEER